MPIANDMTTDDQGVMVDPLQLLPLLSSLTAAMDDIADLTLAVQALKGEVQGLAIVVGDEKKARKTANRRMWIFLVIAVLLGGYSWTISTNVEEARIQADHNACERGNEVRQGLRDFVNDLLIADGVNDAEDDNIRELTLRRFPEIDCDSVH